MAVTAPARAQEDELGSIDLEGVNDIAELDLEALLAAPVVEASSRRAQSLHESPSAVSVLTSEQLASMPVQQPVEALRRVPGLDVIRVEHDHYSAGLRGFSSAFDNHTLTLIDGRAFTEVRARDNTPWYMLPLHLRDLERVEVLRGAGSTLYGANAVGGVISLRGKRPLDHPGVQAASTAGYYVEPAEGARRLHPQADLFAAYGWADSTRRYGVRVSGFTGHPADPRALSPSFAKWGEHRVGLRAALDARPHDELDLELDLTHVMFETSSKATGEAAFFGTEQAARLYLERRAWLHDALTLKLRADGRHVAERIKGGLSLSEPRSGRGHVLLQGDLRLWGGRDVLTVGAEATLDRTRYLSKVEGRSLYLALLGQNETKLTRDGRWLLNVGLRAERIHIERLSDALSITYRNLAPRGALIWRLAERHDLRVAVATAYRTPAPLDSLVGVGLGPELSGATPDAPPVNLIEPRPDLKPEQALSAELGYRGEIQSIARIDAVFYGQRVNGVTRLDHDQELPIYVVNEGHADQLGLEVGVDAALHAMVSAFASYALTLQRDSAHETDRFPLTLATLGLDLALPRGVRAQLNTHFASATTRVNVDLPSLSAERVTLRWPVKRLVNLRVGKQVLDARGEVYLSARNLLGLWLDPSDLKQEGTGAPVGTTLWAGFTLQDRGAP